DGLFLLGVGHSQPRALEASAARVFAVPVEIVKPPHLVRAVVRAITCADAAVVDHGVEAFAVVHGGGDGADLLARRGFAVHAHHGLEDDIRPRVVDRSFEIPIDANPVHLAVDQYILFADDGD